MSCTIDSGICIPLGDYGIKWRFDAGENLTGKELSLVFSPPLVSQITKAATQGNIDIEIDAETTYLAGEYAEYVVDKGLLTKAGIWKVRLQSKTVSPATVRKTHWIQFTVE